MKILHYSLGFPPYRSGGLTKFCVDLMNCQKNNGDEVSLLWPGTMIGKQPHIRKRKPVNGIASFEMVNPLPVSYDEGIKDIDAFARKVSSDVFEKFLDNARPDVIHIHTLMGLYDAFLEAAKKLGIRTVFTTHDFFPMCPKVTLFRNGMICDHAEDCSFCLECNSTALSLTKIQLLQSPVYRGLKDTWLVQKARKSHRDSYFSDELSTGISDNTIDDYLLLQSYYREMIQKLDHFHFNSQVALDVYKLHFGDGLEGTIIPISHSNIEDHRRVKDFSCDPLRIRYLGPFSGAKGYFLLKNALDQLWETNQDFVLEVHIDPVDVPPYMRVHDRYTYSELESIFNETDLLIVPSICQETFGFTVLEALSHGVPVMISGTVGARCILTDGAGIILENISTEKIVEAIGEITPESLKEMNRIIISDQTIETMVMVADNIRKKCYLGG